MNSFRSMLMKVAAIFGSTDYWASGSRSDDVVGRELGKSDF